MDGYRLWLEDDSNIFIEDSDILIARARLRGNIEYIEKMCKREDESLQKVHSTRAPHQKITIKGNRKQTIKQYFRKLNKLMNRITTKEAVDKLYRELKKDGDYYYSWQANIAMPFQDEYWNNFNKEECSEEEIKKIHSISNNAAKRFIDTLIRIN